MALLNTHAPNCPGAQDAQPEHDLPEVDRGYDIVALSLTATRDALHHFQERDRAVHMLC